uniref:Uncharacterized protein n=1 Tax=Romanomermis culicivorax TaxID=13658 RepID=A0A915KTQ9_ROMCU
MFYIKNVSSCCKVVESIINKLSEVLSSRDGASFEAAFRSHQLVFIPCRHFLNVMYFCSIFCLIYIT